MEPRPRPRRNPTGEEPPGGDQRERSRFAPGEWWEWLAIFFAILALWPKILRWQGFWWDVLLWIALAIMVIVFIRRTRRLRRSWRRE